MYFTGWEYIVSNARGLAVGFGKNFHSMYYRHYTQGLFNIQHVEDLALYKDRGEFTKRGGG